jgi:hypothetical protein
MNLDPFRRFVLADVEQRGAEAMAVADDQSRAWLDAAREESQRELDSAREQGRVAAERALASERLGARRRGRAQELAAQRAVLDALRAAVLADLELLRQTHDDRYERLLDRLEGLARGQLGPEAQVARAAEVGGLIATRGGAIVDYTLPAVVDRSLEELGGELSGLWE